MDMNIEYFQQKIKKIIYCNENSTKSFSTIVDMNELLEFSKTTQYVNEMFYMLFQYMLDWERFSLSKEQKTKDLSCLSDEIRFLSWKEMMLSNLLERNTIQPNLKKIFLTISDGKNEISFYENVFRSCLVYKSPCLTQILFKFRKIFISKGDLIDYFKTIEEVSKNSMYELIEWKKHNIYSFLLERIVLCEGQLDFKEYLYILNVFLALYGNGFLHNQILYEKPPYLMLYLDILEWNIFEKVWREKVVSLYYFMIPDLQKQYNAFYMSKMKPHMGGSPLSIGSNRNSPVQQLSYQGIQQFSISPAQSPLTTKIYTPNQSRMLSFFQEEVFS